MKKTALAALSIVVLSSIAFAAPAKTQKFDAPFDKVWIACVQAANENYAVTHTEKESGTIAFQQGFSWKSWSSGTDVGVSVAKVSDTETAVTVHPQRRQGQVVSNISHITSAYFKAVDEKLK